MAMAACGGDSGPADCRASGSGCALGLVCNATSGLCVAPDAGPPADAGPTEDASNPYPYAYPKPYGSP